MSLKSTVFGVRSLLFVFGAVFVVTVPAGARTFVSAGATEPMFGTTNINYSAPANVTMPSPASYAPTVVYDPAPVYEIPGTAVYQPQDSWYYCEDPKGFYPTVSTCPMGWRSLPAKVAHPK